MVRINPDPARASKQLALFGNRQVVRFYEHEELVDGTIVYHKFLFHPDDITPWAKGIKPWISQMAPGDYEEDHETKKRYIVKIYEDRYVLPCDSDEKQTVILILTDFYGEERTPAQKINKLLRKMENYESIIDSLKEELSTALSALREGKTRWKQELLEHKQTLAELENKKLFDELGGTQP